MGEDLCTEQAATNAPLLQHSPILSLLSFPSPPSSLHSIISMLTSFTSSLRPSFSLATRALSTSTTVRQQPKYSEDGSEQVFRPSNVQTKRMDDVGTRSIFTPEQDMFRESVRKFMQDTLAPQQEAFEKAGEPTREAWKAMGAQGLIGVSTPAEVGGIGGTFIDEMIVCEEMSYSFVAAPAMGLHSAIVMPYLTHYGTKDQQEKYLAAMTAGECVASVGMTEPDAGSDLQSMRTTAKRDGDDWIINGSKIYITNGWLTDCCILAAKTKPDAKGHGISLFLVDADAKGFHKGRKLKKLGLKAQDTAELFFEDVRVPGSALLGKENGGFYQLMDQLPQERLIIAVHSAAHCEVMFEQTRDWVKQRKAFGKRVADLQTVQHKLAELKTSITVCRAFIDHCLQLHGGWGFMWETQIAKSYAGARVQTIYGGTNEVMKELIARNIVKK